MARWKPGESGNPTGRKKGSSNIVKLDVRAFWRRLVEDKRYWPQLRRRFNEGKAQHLELYLWQMKFGRAPQVVQIERKEAEVAQADKVRRAQLMTDNEASALYYFMKKVQAIQRAVEAELDRRERGETPVVLPTWTLTRDVPERSMDTTPALRADNESEEEQR